MLHAPELGSAGHVHYLELDQLIGRNYLVTVQRTPPACLAQRHILANRRVDWPWMRARANCEVWRSPESSGAATQGSRVSAGAAR